jgi:hypothetical protein
VRATTTLVATFDDERDAVRAMYKYAKGLRRMRQTERYGVFVEKRCGVWWLNLSDRKGGST